MLRNHEYFLLHVGCRAWETLFEQRQRQRLTADCSVSAEKGQKCTRRDYTVVEWTDPSRESRENTRLLLMQLTFKCRVTGWTLSLRSLNHLRYDASSDTFSNYDYCEEPAVTVPNSRAQWAQRGSSDTFSNDENRNETYPGRPFPWESTPAALTKGGWKALAAIVENY
jgi:hypothetical protein